MIESVEINGQPIVAYFCMEVGLESSMPTYSGGLGILAGDTLRAAADRAIPMVGVTLLHRKGYLRQHLDPWGNQTESPASWSPEDFLEEMPQRATVTLEGRQVTLRAFRYVVTGASGRTVPVYFLDSRLPENSEGDQEITDYLYGGDEHYRLCQEVILGIGGVAMLRALGYVNVQNYHMNEGHCSLLAIALLNEGNRNGRPFTADNETLHEIRRMCVFTTHTPVPAGHDEFNLDLVRQVLGDDITETLISVGACPNGSLNMSHLALNFSDYVNGVSKQHGRVSRQMFSGRPITAVTNGVHAPTWAAPSISEMFDKHVPEWRIDNLYLRNALDIPLGEIHHAHLRAKSQLLYKVEELTGKRLDLNAMTIGFARRATAYKRADLLFSDTDRLRKIASEVGPMQVLYSGKAHARDVLAKDIIRRVFEAAQALRNVVEIIYIEDYNMEIGKLLCAGVDLWLNTPQKPMEASGTSGMKAAINGVPSLSVRDGWWTEGHIEGITGWSIDCPEGEEGNPFCEASSLYHKLEHIILPMYYNRPDDYTQVMRSAIYLNGSFFNTHRMILQYRDNAYIHTNGVVKDAQREQLSA